MSETNNHDFFHYPMSVCPGAWSELWPWRSLCRFSESCSRYYWLREPVNEKKEDSYWLRESVNEKKEDSYWLRESVNRKEEATPLKDKRDCVNRFELSEMRNKTRLKPFDLKFIFIYNNYSIPLTKKLLRFFSRSVTFFTTFMGGI